MKKLALLIVSCATLSTTTAYANTMKYYNCAGDSGECQLVTQDSNNTSSYAQTRYPVALAHGLMAFNQIAGVNYFYQIPETLAEQGAMVFQTKTPSFQSHEIRGEILLGQIETIRAITGKEKVNIIGHSQGGIDGRYIAGVRPEYIASTTSISSPHRGTPFAEMILNIAAKENSDNIVESIGAKIFRSAVELLGTTIDKLSGSNLEQSTINAANSMSYAGSTAFNTTYPMGIASECNTNLSALAANGVHYYSWGGTSQITTFIDPTDWVLAGASLLFKNEANDGLAGRCSTHLGHVIRDDYNMNHGDSANMLFGVVHAFAPNPKTLFTNHANRLKNQGL